MKRCRAQLKLASVLWVVLTSCGLVSTPVGAQSYFDVGSEVSSSELSSARQQQVMRVPASKIPHAQGEALAGLQLFAVREGQLHPISFQLNEFNREGFVYFSQVKVPLEGESGIFDAKDELQFYLNDAGSRWQLKTASMPIITELMIKTEEGARYVYLGRASSDPSFVSEVIFDKRTLSVTTPFYALGLDPVNPINWHSFKYFGSELGSEQKPSSQSFELSQLSNEMNVQMRGGVFSQLAASSLVDADLQSKLVAVQSGALSTILLLRTNVVVASVPVMKLIVYLEAFPQEVRMHTRAAVPKIAGALFTDPVLTVSLASKNSGKSKIESSPTSSLAHNWMKLSMGPNYDMTTYLEALTPSMRLTAEKGFYELKGFSPDDVVKFTTNFVFSPRAKGLSAGRFASQMRNQPNVLSLGDAVVAHYDRILGRKVSGLF